MSLSGPLATSVQKNLVNLLLCERSTNTLLCKIFFYKFQAFLVYTGGVLGNGGNFKGFGDTKFIPNLSKDTFELIVKSSRAYDIDNTHITKLWQNAQNAIYVIVPRLTSLGLSDKVRYFRIHQMQPMALLILFLYHCTPDLIKLAIYRVIHQNGSVWGTLMPIYDPNCSKQWLKIGLPDC